MVKWKSIQLGLRLEVRVQAESECTALRIVAIVNAVAHLGVVAGIGCNRKEVACRSLETQARTMELIGKLAR